MQKKSRREFYLYAIFFANPNPKPKICMVYIKLCTLADAQDLLAVSFQTFEEAFKADNNPENYELYVKKVFTLEVIKEELAYDKNIFFFLMENGTRNIIGYLKLRWDRSEEFFPKAQALELQRIYIKKNYWNGGYGKMLLDFTETYARYNGFDWLWLIVWSENEKGVRFYEREGWEKFGRKDFPFGNEIHHDYAMRKRLKIEN